MAGAERRGKGSQLTGRQGGAVTAVCISFEVALDGPETQNRDPVRAGLTNSHSGRQVGSVCGCVCVYVSV